MRLALGGLLALLAALLFACGGDEAEPRATPTLVPPEISPALRILGEGTLTLDIAAGERQLIEPLRIAEAFGTPPDCARFGFLFRWRMYGDAEVRFEAQLRGATLQIEQGNAGSASVGCMVVEAVNDGARRIQGDVRYYVVEPR